MEIKAKKSLGQNFLKDENILNKIISSVNVTYDDLIIEIGPGKGALTKKLKTLGCDIVAFEIDERMKPVLRELEDEKTTIVFKDFLSINLEEFLISKYNNIHVVANIPYYITNPIINKLLESKMIISDITLMVQNEVADRLSSLPGSKSYGALTIFSNLKYDVKKLFVVPKYSFDPVPKVDSAIVKFIYNNKYDIKDIDKFSKLINDSFQMKRKTLKNNLKLYDWNKVLQVLKSYNLNDNIRAEQIPLDVFVELYNNL